MKELPIYLFEESKLEKRKKEIVSYLIKELLVHAHAEQETFYKALLQHKESKDEATHGEHEHQEIEEQIKVINAATGKSWDNAVLELKELVEHHVKEEENEIFKVAKKLFSDKEAYILKERMHALKGKFLLWLDRREQEAKV